MESCNRAFEAKLKQEVKRTHAACDARVLEVMAAAASSADATGDAQRVTCDAWYFKFLRLSAAYSK